MTEYQFCRFHPPETTPRWLLAQALKKQKNKKNSSALCRIVPQRDDSTADKARHGEPGKGGDYGGLASDGAGEMSHQKEYLNSRSGGMNVPTRLG